MCSNDVATSIMNKSTSKLQWPVKGPFINSTGNSTGSVKICKRIFTRNRPQEMKVMENDGDQDFGDRLQKVKNFYQTYRVSIESKAVFLTVTA